MERYFGENTPKLGFGLMRIGVVPFSPIASGLLSGKVTEKTRFEGDDVRKFVPQFGLALQWALLPLTVYRVENLKKNDN